MTDGSKGGAKNTEQPRGLPLIPKAQIKLILTVSDSFLCVPRIQTMISSGSHHRIPPAAIRMEPLFLDPASARSSGEMSLSLCANKSAECRLVRLRGKQIHEKQKRNRMLNPEKEVFVL